jgi:hypothetical protein
MTSLLSTHDPSEGVHDLVPCQDAVPPPGGSRPLVPVLYIACAGRSGSTLLERVLSTCEGFCATGELRFVWERSYGDNQLCGCGVPFEECPFWEEVSRRLFGVGTAAVDASRPCELRRSLDDLKHVGRLLRRSVSPERSAAFAEYGELLERLYRAILAVSGQRVVIDSTGDGPHGLILSRLAGIELHVVHLVRDSRAVAFSWRRARRRPEIHWASEDMPIEPISTSARRWLMHNLLAERLASSAASYRRLRYEDFASDPDAALAEILAAFPWASPAPSVSAMVLRPTHTVSGNPIRFQQGPIEIELDCEWRKAMQRRDRLVTTAMSWWLLAHYGYRLRSHG